MTDENSPLVRLVVGLSGERVKDWQARYLLLVFAILIIVAAILTTFRGAEGPSKKPPPLPLNHHEK